MKRKWKRGCRVCNWTGWRPSADPNRVERCDCLRNVTPKSTVEVVDRKAAAAGDTEERAR